MLIRSSMRRCRDLLDHGNLSYLPHRLRPRTTRLKKDFRRCLVLYFYFLDAEFGLLHVRLPTWFPLTIQIYVNGHEWLARQLDRQHIGYQRRDKAFLFLGDPAQAQRVADRLLRKKWPGFLTALAKRCNPLLAEAMGNRL